MEQQPNTYSRIVAELHILAAHADSAVEKMVYLALIEHVEDELSYVAEVA